MAWMTLGAATQLLPGEMDRAVLPAQTNVAGRKYRRIPRAGVLTSSDATADNH